MSKKSSASSMRRLARQKKQARLKQALERRAMVAKVIVLTEHLPAAGAKVIEVGVYFRSEGAEGISFVITSATPAGRAGLLDTVRNMIDDYDNAHAEPADLLEQLELLGARGTHALRNHEHLIALVNICWLELRGHLKADEHNGVLWAVEKVAS